MTTFISLFLDCYLLSKLDFIVQDDNFIYEKNPAFYMWFVCACARACLLSSFKWLRGFHYHEYNPN